MDRNDDFSTADGAPPTYERLNADHGSEANGDARPMEPSAFSANVTPPGEPGTIRRRGPSCRPRTSLRLGKCGSLTWIEASTRGQSWT